MWQRNEGVFPYTPQTEKTTIFSDHIESVSKDFHRLLTQSIEEILTESEVQTHTGGGDWLYANDV